MRKTGMTYKLWSSAEFQARRIARVVVPIIVKLRDEMNAWLQTPKAPKFIDRLTVPMQLHFSGLVKFKLVA